MRSLIYPPAEEISDFVLQRVYEKQGRISSVCWKNGSCSFAITGCLPSEIVFDRACAISYSHKIQTFAASFMVKDETAEFMEAGLEPAEVKNMLSDSLENAGAKVQVDFISADELSLKFFVPGTDLAAAFDSCVRCENIAFWHEKELSLSVKNSGVFVTVKFARGIVSSPPLMALLGSYSELFVLENPVLAFAGAHGFQPEGHTPFVKAGRESQISKIMEKK